MFFGTIRPVGIKTVSEDGVGASGKYQDLPEAGCEPLPRARAKASIAGATMGDRDRKAIAKRLAARSRGGSALPASSSSPLSPFTPRRFATAAAPTGSAP